MGVWRQRIGASIVATFATAAACAPRPVPPPILVQPKPYMRLVSLPAEPRRSLAEIGAASWYGPRFNGRLTSNGETFDQSELTAAHPTLPFGTWVRVTNLETGHSVYVRINDRGPFIDGRVIDLSYGAARALGMVRRGIVTVAVEPLHQSRF